VGENVGREGEGVKCGRAAAETDRVCTVMSQLTAVSDVFNSCIIQSVADQQ